MNEEKRDRELGMHRRITRRDFLDGVSIAVGAAAMGTAAAHAQSAAAPASNAPGAGPYPPNLSGLRGSHAGSFEVAHAVRDGKTFDNASDDGDTWDLIVVGGGISGLAAAWFYRKSAGASARILILDNHDDFGGHAKRNEFRVGGKSLIGYGGTQSIEAPSRYSPEARGLLTDLGIETDRFYKYFDQKFYESRNMTRGVFFDKETYGVDRLVANEGKPTWADYLERTPFSEKAKKDMLRIQTEKIDYMPGLAAAEKQEKLRTMSYEAFLRDFAKVDQQVITYFMQNPHPLWAMGIDAVPALNNLTPAVREGLALPANQGRGGGGAPGTAARQPEPYIFHFPDGNASVARMLVRSLIPACAPGNTMEDVVTARFNYSKLDVASSPVRLRLNSTVVRVRPLDTEALQGGEVTYVVGGKARRTRAPRVVLACNNTMIPYLCPEIPAPQKEALAYGERVPLIYTNVVVRNWRAFQKLGVSRISYPTGYYSSVDMDFPVSVGDYRFPSTPDEPVVLHMLRTPCRYGVPAKEQYRAGRRDMLATPFTVYERNIREQLGRALGSGGFDPAADIAAITVNRWAHGYAYEYPSLWERRWDPNEKPNVIARKRFGKITIANSDAGAHAYTDGAIDQAWRAVQELVQN
jgi:spermidine dehydrogenase